MIINIKSSNPNLSFVIKKNPASGMNCRSLREGTLFNWYDSPTSYNAYFKDSMFASSYSLEEKDYLDTTQLNSPLLAYDMLCELFIDNQKKITKDDIETDFEVTVSAIHFAKPEKLVINFFPDVHFEFKQLANHTHNLKITCKNKTFHYLVNVLTLVFAHQAFKFDRYAIHFDEMKKIMGFLNNVQAPYFARYVFKFPSMRFPEKWKEIQPVLSTDKIKMTYGDNEQSRKDFANIHLSKKYNILDIGCGEGVYFNHSKDVEKYYAVDVDPLVRQDALDKIEKRQYTNVSLHSSLEEVKTTDKVDVLLIEVIEHMPLESAEEILKKAMTFNFNKIILTTPNKDFNKNYLMSSQFRHYDHHFEFTEGEFKEWVKKVVPSHELKFHQVGDVVEGSSTSMGVIIYGK